MELITSPLNKKEIARLQKTYGNYSKITTDLKQERLVIGSELHADGEELLLQTGSQQDNIWGGGIDLAIKEIDTTAVLNLRPRLNNNSLEILDPQRRTKFLQLVAATFRQLWN